MTQEEYENKLIEIKYKYSSVCDANKAMSKLKG